MLNENVWEMNEKGPSLVASTIAASFEVAELRLTVAQEVALLRRVRVQVALLP